MSIGSFAASPFTNKAKKLRSRASSLDRVNTLVRNLQNRRSFIRAARQAQAQALVAGVATGAGLDSSGVQGNLTSLKTQEQFALFEAAGIQHRSQTASLQRAEAVRLEALGSNIAGGVDAFVSIAKAS